MRKWLVHRSGGPFRCALCNQSTDSTTPRRPAMGGHNGEACTLVWQVARSWAGCGQAALCGRPRGLPGPPPGCRCNIQQNPRAGFMWHRGLLLVLAATRFNGCPALAPCVTCCRLASLDTLPLHPPPVPAATQLSGQKAATTAAETWCPASYCPSRSLAAKGTKTLWECSGSNQIVLVSCRFLQQGSCRSGVHQRWGPASRRTAQQVAVCSAMPGLHYLPPAAAPLTIDLASAYAACLVQFMPPADGTPGLVFDGSAVRAVMRLELVRDCRKCARTRARPVLTQHPVRSTVHFSHWSAGGRPTWGQCWC